MSCPPETPSPPDSNVNASTDNANVNASTDNANVNTSTDNAADNTSADNASTDITIANNGIVQGVHCRFKIYFEDDGVCQRSQQTVQQLLSVAMDESPQASTSNSAMLAKKALKYRKLYKRMAGVDVNAPEFDAASFLGVSWCKTTSLKEHCRQLPKP